MRTLLITRASGVLGWNLCVSARERWRTLGIVHRHPADLPGVARVTCDLTCPKELRRLFQAVAPDALIHMPVGARTAATGLLMALGVGGGILHLGGRERVSRYGLGILMGEMLGADAGLIVPGRQRDRQIGTPRPPDVSLDSSRAYALGYDPLPLDEELKALLRDLRLIA